MKPSYKSSTVGNGSSALMTPCASPSADGGILAPIERRLLFFKKKIIFFFFFGGGGGGGGVDVVLRSHWCHHAVQAADDGNPRRPQERLWSEGLRRGRSQYRRRIPGSRKGHYHFVVRSCAFRCLHYCAKVASQAIY